MTKIANNEIGADSIFSCNPGNTTGGKDVNGDTLRPAFFGLTYELEHGKAAVAGNQLDAPKVEISGRTPRSEK
ncbi:MAG: hypothetical protein ABW069_17330 [Duganella sp.]